MVNGRAPLQFSIDQPAEWRGVARCVVIRGWCFAPDGGPVQAIRLRVANGTVAGVVGLPRPDVKAALPAAPDENTGFEIRAILPGGRHELVLEAGLSNGTWQPLFNQRVEVSRTLRPRWLGGGSSQELIAFQLPAHLAYPARPLPAESFPASSAGAAPWPRFSIVTPSYNHARFLEATMRSVLEQPDVACDYVVQDGASTDNSAALIAQFDRQYGHAATHPRPSPAVRLSAWASERDGGQADAIARGFARTSGGPDDVMAWINSDDFYQAGVLRYVASYFARHPEVDVLYGHRILVNEEAREIGRWFLPKHDPAVLRLNDFVPQETMFWRRRIWDRVGGIDTSFRFALDWDLLLRFQAAGAKIVRVPYFLACFRIHSAQKTTAQMQSVGQTEINRLRERTFGRPFPAQELETTPALLRYLRRSAFIEFLWRLGLRAP